MSGLVLKLGPKERVLVNGAVIENGDRRSKLSILTPNANILRLRDAINPNDATTPVRKVCYVAQLILSGDADPSEGRKQLLSGLNQLGHALTDPESVKILSQAKEAFEVDEFYRGLKRLRALLPVEGKLLRGARHLS